MLLYYTGSGRMVLPGRLSCGEEVAAGNVTMETVSCGGGAGLRVVVEALFAAAAEAAAAAVRFLELFSLSAFHCAWANRAAMVGRGSYVAWRRQ